MKIKRVRIENFCCLHKVDIAFEEISCFIGPTGVGKSTVLRALDWFFNGERSLALSTDDVHSAAESERISVEVEFDGLTDEDREALQRYAPQGAESMSIWRTWQDGEDKITGKALAYAPFEEVRRHEKAMDLRRAYKELMESDPSLGLRSVGSAAAAEESMRVWELAHRDQLTETEIEGTHFFGFAGQSKLAELIDFVFISADLRAHEEADDRKKSALARILDHTVDRTEANEQLEAIEENAHQERLDVHSKVYGPVLEDISAALSREVAQFTVGREIVVSPVVQAPKLARTTFQISVQDGAAQTSVHRQGHGFQRALIIAALKLLAERRRPGGVTRTLCLAIEEPELFQHPPQARVFAEVLRGLVVSPAGRTQVMYATHHPVFIESRSYHEVRRLSRDGGTEHPVTRVSQVSEAELCRDLSELVSEASIRRKAGIMCAGTLAEGFFARAVVLVEGNTDGAVLTGCAERMGLSLGAQGVSVIDVGGKSNIFLCHAILTALGVPTYVVFDGDAGKAERSRSGVQQLPEPERLTKEAKIEEQTRKDAEENANLLGYLGAPRTPWPATASAATHAVFEDTLEVFLNDAWPSWGSRRRELIDSGHGFGAKNTATYREAALKADSGPPFELIAMLENVTAMAG
ncbi:ATP-dependent endonuclease [Streptomyces sp. NBC_01381]|uniref:ATP-dependent nuclease n=1 Tax=Streptomyces sp. NBC_01381 TaxID=2903845 RepID=UPI002256C59E|nr:AAA family ATPase [Streptomyces sp. NBC_01381]MCX4667973.1 ATP-dependent endonuclease [Streptomyces sp. NBC_01381]